METMKEHSINMFLENYTASSSSPPDNNPRHFHNTNNPTYTITTIKEAWCQSDKLDYCPIVISLMSFVIIISFIMIIYLFTTTTTLKCPCDILRRRFSRQRRLQRNHHLLNSSTNYINNDSSTSSSTFVTLHAINQFNPTTTTTPMSIWWTNTPPPSYDELQTQQCRSKKPQIVCQKQKVSMIVENLSFPMENFNTVVVENQMFPMFTCLNFKNTIGFSSDVCDEMPPPYELVAV